MQILLLAVLVIAGVVQLVLAGCGVAGRRYRPEWMGLACLAAAVTWPIVRALTTVGGA